MFRHTTGTMKTCIWSFEQNSIRQASKGSLPAHSTGLFEMTGCLFLRNAIHCMTSPTGTMTRCALPLSTAAKKSRGSPSQPDSRSTVSMSERYVVT